MAQEIADSRLIDTWSSDGLKVKPDISKIIEGWQLGEQPPHEYMNWLQNTFGSKLNHILKNGVATWDNTTQYLAGSSVQHSGNVWLCKATNTNSAPTDANANWKRIITVESLTTVLGGYVALTGNQTIAGIKTFSSTITGSVNGNSATATKLATARSINGVAFDGTANITIADNTKAPLNGTGASGTWDISITGNANTATSATTSTSATKLATARTIGGVSFDGSANINLPGVNTAGNQNTTGNAATVTNGVYTTGNQTIDGVKTFSLSPIVPTPTTGTQAVNKDYVDANAGISLTTANSYDLGVGQTWQNVTASRSVGVTYTNTTGKPIQVIITNKAGSTSVDFNIIINGVTRSLFVIGPQPNSNQFGVLTAIIPNGSTYSTTSFNSSVLHSWHELR